MSNLSLPNTLISSEENLVNRADPLSLGLDPKKIIERLDRRITDSKTWFKLTKKVEERQDRNKDYLMGRQWDETQVIPGQARYMNNIIFEAEGIIKPIALSRLPDIVIKQGINSDQAREDAEALGAIFKDEMKKREERQVVGIAFSHHKVYYVGVIKPFWDSSIGVGGDYVFNFIHPKLMIFDSMANSLDVTKHNFIGNYWPMTVEECVLRFPKAKDKLLRELKIDKAPTKQMQAKMMGSTIKIAEVHFKYLEKREDGGVTQINAVLWKYNKCFLDMMKDPNWDWEGEERIFYYDPEKMDKQNPKKEHLQDVLLHNHPNSLPGMPNTAPTSPQLGVNGELPGNLKKEKLYRNHFKTPRFPYILLGYNQWGEMVYDETSGIEQVIPLQDNVNVRGRQITDIANRSRGKEIWALSSGMKKKDIENLDPAALAQDITVRGNPRDVHEHVEGDQPKPALFQEMQLNIGYIFSKLGTHDSTRGVKQGKGKQQEQQLIQQDMGKIDDVAENTVNYAVEQMLGWRMQFIKLRYTEDHLREIIGPEGQSLFYRLNRDMIHDNMDGVVTASGVDKMLRKQEAYERLKMKATDMLSFYEDIDVSNPRGRAEKWYLQNKNPDMWYEKFVKNKSLQQIAASIPGAPGNPQTQPPIGNPGVVPPVPPTGQPPV